MLDRQELNDTLDAIGLGEWRDALDALLADRLAPGAHGNLAGWQAAIDRLPVVTRSAGNFDDPAIGAPDLRLGERDASAARDALAALGPWRKGPFRIGDILIDSEWRSDLKWDRIARAMSSLENRLVLDVGCGNGYYALRMRAAGARAVIGVDPTLVYVAQFTALGRFFAPEPVHVLPIRLEELPPAAGRFDSVFSMGVLYHSRAPIDHLRLLRDALRRGGELVLETIVLPGDDAMSRTPADRYARMRNVWHLPTVPELLTWIERAGFREPRVADVSLTTSDEQRSTAWMTFESLAEALDPDDPTLTVEGWPAPRRAVIVARTPDGNAAR